MKTLRKNNIFNDRSISIFTDASFRAYNKYSGVGTVCSGACVYNNDVLIDQQFYIQKNKTVQQGELYAILMGVSMAYKYRNFGTIRLFSDSQTSIFAIRDRIFKWLNLQKRYGGILDEGGEIKNVDYIMNIIHTLLTNNVPIELYHVKGHVNVNSNNSLINAINVFRASNRISMNVDYDLIRQISECNDQVDRFTKFMLNYEVNPKEYTEAIAFGYGGIDTNRYRGLLNGKVG
jgi:ribonuclease H